MCALLYLQLYWFILNSIVEFVLHFGPSCQCIFDFLTKDCYQCPSFKFTDAIGLVTVLCNSDIFEFALT